MRHRTTVGILNGMKQVAPDLLRDVVDALLGALDQGLARPGGG
jgi:hypothetical protein